jgi:predicted RNase H-like nuclease (RuvC/YqgF family)
MAETSRPRKTTRTASRDVETRQLRRALEEAEEKLRECEARRTRAVARATVELRRENDMLEAQLTRLVQEIGQMRAIVDRVERVEREARAKDLRIAELEADIDRLRQALESGRPTAIAAAAAAGTMRKGRKR